MNKGDLSTYKKILPEIFSLAGSAIGVHVMLIVLERSLWKTKSKYPEAQNIYFSEEGIFLDKLDEMDHETAILAAHEFVMCIIETLGRLIGKQLAEKLMIELLNESV